jgi:hypothetical protein
LPAVLVVLFLVGVALMVGGVIGDSAAAGSGRE